MSASTSAASDSGVQRRNARERRARPATVPPSARISTQLASRCVGQRSLSTPPPARVAACVIARNDPSSGGAVCGKPQIGAEAATAPANVVGYLKRAQLASMPP